MANSSVTKLIQEAAQKIREETLSGANLTVEEAVAEAARKKDEVTTGKRKSFQYTDQQIMAAFTLTDGLVYRAAERLHCYPSTLFRRLNKSKKLREHRDNCRGILLDDAEDALAKQVRSGEQWAVSFTLRTLGKERGYVERSEVTGKDGESLNSDLSDEERAARIASLFDRARNRRDRNSSESSEVGTPSGTTE